MKKFIVSIPHSAALGLSLFILGCSEHLEYSESKDRSIKTYNREVVTKALPAMEVTLKKDKNEVLPPMKISHAPRVNKTQARKIGNTKQLDWGKLLQQVDKIVPVVDSEEVDQVELSSSGVQKNQLNRNEKENSSKEDLYQLPQDLHFKMSGTSKIQNSPISGNVKKDKLSHTVLEAIQREISSNQNSSVASPIPPREEVQETIIDNANNSEVSENDEDLGITEFTYGEMPKIPEHQNKVSTQNKLNTQTQTPTPNSTPPLPKNEIAAFQNNGEQKFVENDADDSDVIKVNIEAIDALQKQNENKNVFGYEFIPFYDRNDRQNDFDGVVNLEYSLKNEYSHSITGFLTKKGYIDTQIDVVMPITKNNEISGSIGPKELNIQVPMFEEEEFLKLMRSKDLPSDLGYVLVDFGDKENVTALDIDMNGGQYDKILFDENLKAIENAIPEKNIRYILLSGVQLGNGQIRIKIDQQWAEKIINVQNNMVTFVDGSALRESEFDVALFKESQSQKLIELSPSMENLKLFESKNEVKKLGLNRYNTMSGLRVLGHKDYLWLKDESPTFIELNEFQTDYVVPTEKDKQDILKNFQLQDLAQHCLIHIQGKNDILNVRTGGFANDGEIFTETIYQDRDGVYSYDPEEWTKKAFIIGDRSGILSIHIEYSNGKSAVTNAYCAPDTYMVLNP